MRIASISAVVLLVLLNAGCKPATEISHHADEIAVPTYSAKTGLALPETTRRSLDLKLVEITEQKLETILPLSLRIYQTDRNTILTTGLLSPEQARHFQLGQPVAAELSAGTTLTGVVTRVRTELHPATGSHELLVAFPTAPPGLAAGDFLNATTRIISDSNVVTIPRRALLENSEGQFAYTVSGEHFVRTAIKTGTRNDEFIEVTDGLYAGDQVVLQPVMSLWLTELASVKGGQACCVTPPKGK